MYLIRYWSLLRLIMERVFIPLGGAAKIISMTAFLVVVVLGPAQASEKSAKRVVEKVNVRIAKMLADYPKELNAQGAVHERIVTDLEQLMRDHFNMEAISQAVLGPAWRRANSEQRGTFQKVFTRYLAQKYSPSFPELVGADFNIVGSKELKKNHYVVDVDANFGDRTTKVKWYALKYKGATKIVNLALTNNNILNIETKVIRSLLHQRSGDLDKLSTYLPFRFEKS